MQYSSHMQANGKVLQDYAGGRLLWSEGNKFGSFTKKRTWTNSLPISNFPVENNNVATFAGLTVLCWQRVTVITKKNFQIRCKQLLIKFKTGAKNCKLNLFNESKLFTVYSRRLE